MQHRLLVQGTMEVGAVGNLQHVRQAISAARLVLQHSQHTLLAGLQATLFAQAMVRTAWHYESLACAAADLHEPFQLLLHWASSQCGMWHALV